MSAKILVVDDTLLERLLVEAMLSRRSEYQIELSENGKEALKKIAADPPDLVITDLIMPEMDGLDLVRTVRRRHPEIPVVVMTGYGDEPTAIEALESGAASYIAKSLQAELLMATVDRLLEQAAADRSRRQLAESMLEYQCRFALANDRQLIRALVNQVQNAMAGLGFADTVERIRVSEAFEEALLNAMYHGNLEVSGEELAEARAQLDDRLLDRLVNERCRDPMLGNRKSLVVVHLTQTEARFVIRDEGRGFNALFAMEDETSCYGAPGSHRGMTLIRSLMDDVSYNQAGNELVLRKRHQNCPSP